MSSPRIPSSRSARAKQPPLIAPNGDIQTQLAPRFALFDAERRFRPSHTKPSCSIAPHLGEFLKGVSIARDEPAEDLWTLQQACHFEPQVFYPDHLHQLNEVFGSDRGFSYFLYYLTQHADVRQQTRQAAQALLARERRFLLQESASVYFRKAPKSILIIHSYVGNLGDELIRVPPILQALLAARSDHKLRVITRRPYLYENPLLRAVSMDDQEGLEDVLDHKFDVIINHHDPAQRRFSGERNLSRLVKAKKQQNSHTVWINRDAPEHRYTFRSIEVDGQDVLDSLGLESYASVNSHAYEPTHQLLAEFGLPIAMSPGQRRHHNPLLPSRNTESGKVLDDFAPHAARNDRPLWVVNPFGGEFREKGFYQGSQIGGFGALRQHLRSWIQEGRDLVILPNHQAWGRPEVIHEIARGLPVYLRRHVSIGPDPLVDAWKIKHLVFGSEGVIAVEGGLVHLAHALGKPFRVLSGPSSGNSFWLPFSGLDYVMPFQPKKPVCYDESRS